MSGLILPYRDKRPVIAADAYVAPTATVVGDVEVGAAASLWFGVVVRADVNDVRIGAGTNIQDGTVIHVSRTLQGTYIGSDVTIGHLALVHACTLHDGAFIGMKACVMDGAVVETGAMVAAGALVTPGKRVRTGELWAGLPAQPMRTVTAQELAGFRATVDRYKDLAVEYLAAARAAHNSTGPA